MRNPLGDYRGIRLGGMGRNQNLCRDCRQESEMRFKTKDARSEHYFGDFYTLNSKEKRRAVRKKFAEYDKQMKREDREAKRLLKENKRRKKCQAN